MIGWIHLQPFKQEFSLWQACSIKGKARNKNSDKAVVRQSARDERNNFTFVIPANAGATNTSVFPYGKTVKALPRAIPEASPPTPEDSKNNVAACARRH